MGNLFNNKAENPSQNIIDQEGYKKLLQLSKGKTLVYDQTQTFVDMFLAHAVQTPQAIASVDISGSLSYKDLDQRSNALAHILLDKGVEQRNFVCVMLKRTNLFPLSILAIQKVGAAYVPLDLEYPKDRLAYMAQNSESKVILTTRDVYDVRKSEGDFAFENVEIVFVDELDLSKETQEINLATPDDLAYMIYTSGSTGLPKGTMLSHRSLRAFLAWRIDELQITNESRHAVHPSFSFDASLDDLLCPLAAGASCHILDEETRKDLDSIYQFLKEHKITGLTMSTAIGMAMLNQYADLPLKFMMLGGEKMLPFPKTNIKVLNGYGPTEFTVCSSFHVVDQDKNEDIPIGRPVPNSYSFICDKAGNLVPQGEAGEICLMGAQMANGYWKREDLTAEKFCVAPFMPTQKMYRTGDLGRYNESEELEYLGRIDNQVKLRGYRIELGEVENQVKSFDGVLSVLVDLREIGGVKHLCAYFTAVNEVDTAKLKEHVAQALADYMVPSVFIQMEQMPLTPNGKIDRKKLPQPEIELEEIIAPENETESALFEIVAEILSNREFGVTNNLISLGLTSLLSMRLSVLISRRLGAKTTIKDILLSPTIRALAELINASERAEEDAPSYEKQQFYPLTENQKGIYIAWEQNKQAIQYNLPAVLRFKSVDCNRLEEALHLVIEKHPGVKSRLRTINGEILIERSDERQIQIKRSELIDSPTQKDLQSRVLPFDLFEDDLSRFEIITTPEESYLFVDLHHIIFDGGSLAVFLSDLHSAYEGKAIESEIFTPFDRALQELEILNERNLEDLDKYFDSLICSGDTTTYPHSAQTAASGIRSLQTRIKGEQISALVKSIKATESNFFLAMTMQVLHRHLREEHIQITSISNGRGDHRLSNSLGMFVKSIPVVSNLKDEKETVAQAVCDVQSQMIETISRDIYPFTRLVERRGVRAEIMFAYQQNINEYISFEDCDFIPLELGVARLPIAIQVSPIGDGDYALSVEYDGALYDERSMWLLGENIKNLAENIGSKDDILSNVPLISKAEFEQLMHLSEGEHIEYDKNETIVDVVLRNTIDFAENIAVVDKCSQMSYKELGDYSNNVAARLLEMGLVSDEFVGVMLPRRKEFSVAQLGVMRAGGAYVPMDVEYPNDRIEYMLKDSQARVLITTKELYAKKQTEGDFEVENVLYIEDIVATQSLDEPINNASPERNAYMIYTSGSTGKPKGVVIEHKALYLFILWHTRIMQITSSSKVGFHFSFSFDASILDSIPPLFVGGTLHIISSQMRHDFEAFYNYLCDKGIDAMSLPTQFGMELINRYGDLPLSTLGLGGEKLLPTAKTSTRLINYYGPTEFTVASSWYEVKPEDEDIPIGRPAPNSASYIVDKNGNLISRGLSGELCLSGIQRAKGYWQREELTAEKFVECSFAPGNTMYKTGDLARWNDEGMLEYLGRIDNQVKLRGFRIELGEIENQVKSYEAILSAAVEVREIGGVQHLCAYYTSEQEVDKDKLKAYISLSLTDYMVPTAYMQMEAMPLTPNGKIDRKKLPQPQLERTAEFVEPSNEGERQICRLFCEQLALDRVSANDDYFLIGGSSLSAIRLIIEINKLGYDLKYADLFRLKTPEKIAEFIGGEIAQQAIDGEHFNVADYDYTAINSLLSESCNLDNIDDLKAYTLKSVLLTGATGYLGVYLLNHLILSGTQKIYCLVRPSENIGAAERLKTIYAYYFDDLDVFENGVVEVIEGDITDENLDSKLSGYNFDTLINPAAMVKHFIADDSMYRANVVGVENLISLCEKNGSRLIHVSTYSVAGMLSPQDAEQLKESKLYFGQMNDNEYVHTKFLAERAILQAVADGRVDAKIMRVGNLMGRENDGEFQINFRSNAFVNSIKSFKVLGSFPLNGMSSPVEVSPINRVAEAIVLLSATPRQMLVFHPFNPYQVDMGALVKSMNNYGFCVKPENDETFKQRVKDLSQDPKKSIYLQGLIHSAANHTELIETPVDNAFTTTVLYHLDFYWSVVNNDYFVHLLESLDLLGFFDE